MGQGIVERRQLVGKRGFPLWRYMLGIQVVLALIPTALLGETLGYGPVLLISLAVSWLLWGSGLPILVLRMSGESVATQIRLETRQALRAWAGKPMVVEDYSTAATPRRRTTGSAMAYDGDYLYVVDMGQAVRIPPEEVRSWQWYAAGVQRMELWGRARGSGAALVDAAAINDRLASEAHEASGMTITVNDVSNPTWRFTCSDVRILEKWDSILNQVASG